MPGEQRVGLDSMLVLLCSLVMFAESHIERKGTWTLGNLSYLLCCKENTLVFPNTYNWLFGNLLFAGAVESNSLHDEKRISNGLSVRVFGMCLSC